jgi:tetratricopeptide (TPR) repeat protein
MEIESIGFHPAIPSPSKERDRERGNALAPHASPAFSLKGAGENPDLWMDTQQDWARLGVEGFDMIFTHRHANDSFYGGLKGKSMKALVSILLLIMLGGCGLNDQAELPYDMTIANRGYQAMVKQNYEEAEAFFDLALSVNPENPYALLNLGVVYHNTGRLEQAKQLYRKVIELNSATKAKYTTDTKFTGSTLSEIAEKNLLSIEN